ncbi:MAG: phage holin family protein [Deltaproteobacteria bacterium]|nr:phage holin family protein [Deltaproteobacteria bacterium]
MYFIITLVLNALALLLVSRVISGIRIDDFLAAVFAALVLGLLNALIRPILVILTLPLNILTLGLFTFVINALMLWIAAAVVSGFSIDRFFPTAVLAAVLLAVINMLIHLAGLR